MSNIDDMLFRLQGGWLAVFANVIQFLIKWFSIAAIFGFTYWLLK